MRNNITFDFWKLERILVHEIFLREQELIPPMYASSTLSLDNNATKTFFDRVQNAISNDSKCMEMEIINKKNDSFLHHADRLLKCTTDDEFVKYAKPFADLLTNAQASRNIPGGILIIFTGTVSSYKYRFIGALKAESQDGFTREKIETGFTLKLMTDLFLTPSARLYKIGLFIATNTENPEHGERYRAFIYDHQMSKNKKDNAAIYFYDNFLGCGFLRNAARETKNFFDYTRDFIFKHSRFSDDEKYLYYSDLQSYLRRPATTIQVAEFSQSFIHDDADMDAYENFMRNKDFPTGAIHKDTRDIINNIKTRKLRFKSSIKISGPAEIMDNLVTVERIHVAESESGEKQEWTKIIIKDKVLGTE